MKNLFTLLAFCACISSFAQINFEPGYFISANGTKIQCLIKNVAWKNNPLSFEYRINENSPIEVAGIDQVTEFTVSGYKFEKYTVSIDRSSADISHMSIQRAPEYKKETLYLKVLVEGSATLYKYEDGNLVRFFISKDKALPEQLVYKPYIVDNDIHYNTEFRGQLFAAMKDKMPQSEFTGLECKQGKLVNLFLKYNGQDSPVVNYTGSQNKGKFHLKVTPGVTFSSLNLKQSGLDLGGNTNKSSQVGFRIGFEAEFVFPFNNNKWSIFADPNYQYYANTHTETLYPGGMYESTRTWKSDYTFIEVPVGIRHYLYLNQDYKLFLDAAYVIGIPTSKEDIMVATDGYLNYNLKAETGLSTGFAAGLGFAAGRFAIEARYNLKREIVTNYVSWDGKFSSLNLIAGYRFL